MVIVVTKVRIRITVYQISLTFDLEVFKDVYGDLSSMGVTYKRYMLLAAINTLIIFLRLIAFLGFSRRLSTLLKVIARAKISLFFFAVMFLIVLLSCTS